MYPPEITVSTSAALAVKELRIFATVRETSADGSNRQRFGRRKRGNKVEVRMTGFLLLSAASAMGRAIATAELRSGDCLRIVFTRGDFGRKLDRVISAEGDITLPTLPTLPLAGALHVAGMTLSQAERSIEQAYYPSCWPPPLKVSLSRCDLY